MNTRISGLINIETPLNETIRYRFESDRSLVEVLVFTVDSLKLIYPDDWELAKTTINYGLGYIYIVFELCPE